MAIMNNFPVGDEDKERIYCYYIYDDPFVAVSPDDKDNHDIYAVYSSGKNYQSSDHPMGVCCSRSATEKSYTIKVLCKMDTEGYYLCMGGHSEKGSKPIKSECTCRIDLSKATIGTNYKVINKGSCKFEVYKNGTLLYSSDTSYGSAYVPYVAYITNQ